LRNEKITYKIREHSLQKLPYQLIVGEKEKAAEKVAVRTRSGEDLGQMFLLDFIACLRSEAKAGSTLSFFNSWRMPTSPRRRTQRINIEINRPEVRLIGAAASKWHRANRPA